MDFTKNIYVITTAGPGIMDLKLSPMRFRHLNTGVSHQLTTDEKSYNSEFA